MPNRKPEASGGKSLRMSDMSGSNQRHDEHGGDACCHECSGRHHRTLRQAADAAHAVAAGAAATEKHSETGEQARRDQPRPTGEDCQSTLGAATNRNRPKENATTKPSVHTPTEHAYAHDGLC